MKTKLIKQTGILISGISQVTLWDGSHGEIDMHTEFLPLGQITKERLLNCVNDGRFGVQSIDSADIEIYTKYDNGSTEFDRTIPAYLPQHVCLFGKKGI
jgi:hypothetical protein